MNPSIAFNWVAAMLRYGIRNEGSMEFICDKAVLLKRRLLL